MMTDPVTLRHPLGNLSEGFFFVGNSLFALHRATSGRGAWWRQRLSAERSAADGTTHPERPKRTYPLTATPWPRHSHATESQKYSICQQFGESPLGTDGQKSLSGNPVMSFVEGGSRVSR